MLKDRVVFPETSVVIENHARRIKMAEKVKILAIEDDSEMGNLSRLFWRLTPTRSTVLSPDKEGLEKVKEVSKEYSNLPILVITAIHTQSEFHFSPETDREYLPVNDFVEKPIGNLKNQMPRSPNSCLWSPMSSDVPSQL